MKIAIVFVSTGIGLWSCLFAAAPQLSQRASGLPTVITVKKAADGDYDYTVDSRQVTAVKGQRLYELLRAAQRPYPPPYPIVILVDHQLLATDLWGIGRELSPITSSRQSVRYFVTNGTTMFEVTYGAPRAHAAPSLEVPAGSKTRGGPSLVITVERTETGLGYVIDGERTTSAPGRDARTLLSTAQKQHRPGYTTTVLYDDQLPLGDLLTLDREIGRVLQDRRHVRDLLTRDIELGLGLRTEDQDVPSVRYFATSTTHRMEITFGPAMTHTTNPGR